MPNTSPKSSRTRDGPAPGGSRAWASPTLRRSSSQTCGSVFLLYWSWMVTVTIDRPGLDSDVTCLSWPSRCTAVSMTSVTSSSTSFAVAPG